MDARTTQGSLSPVEPPSAEREISAIGALIAHRDTPLPLCVGLFGDVGMGKTRFLGQLERRIEQLAAAERRARAEGRPGPCCAEIEQVHFNAWHYQEANLSACLVDGIFDTLARRYRPDPARERESALREMLSARTSLAEAQARLAEAREQVGQAERTLEEHRAEIVEIQKRISLRDLRALLKTDARLDARFKEALGQIRAPGNPKNLEVVLGAFKDASSLQTRLEVAIAGLAGRQDRSRIYLGVLFWVFVVPLLSLAVALGVHQMQLGGSSEVFATLGAVVTAVGAGAARLRVLFASFGKALDAYDTTLEQVETVLREVDAQAMKALEDDQAAMDASRAAESETLAAIEASRERLRVAEATLDEMRRKKLFPKFILARSDSAEYDAQMSFLQVIHEDLATLFGLLEASDDPEDPPPVERIVLHIADLNRCGSEQIVRVLRTVNLLLTFDLFVVVLSVDAQRLLRLVGEEEPTAASGLARVTRAYLENTFQLPYQMRQVDAVELEQLLTARLGRAERTDPGPSPEPALDADPFEIGAYERAFMGRLVGLLPSPRSVARFVATLQFARAALAAVDPDFFLPDRPGVGATQILLAVAASHPQQFPRLVDALREVRDPCLDLRSFLSQVLPDPTPGTQKAADAGWLRLCRLLGGIPRQGDPLIQVQHLLALAPLLGRVLLPALDDAA